MVIIRDLLDCDARAFDDRFTPTHTFDLGYARIFGAMNLSILITHIHSPH
jgi:hypothetical protein